MEKINGRFYGSCYECGHSVPVDSNDEPLVECIPEVDLKDKYAQGCRYLIPKCEHNALDLKELKKPVKK